MVKVGHLALPVRDAARSRDWYVAHFGFRVEFEVPERAMIAIQDDADFTLFLVQEPTEPEPRCSFALEVEDVERTHRELVAKGVVFDAAPQKLFWGYGAELRDPDGYRLSVWDARSMKEKGGG